jgi:hypothetical protein
MILDSNAFWSVMQKASPEGTQWKISWSSGVSRSSRSFSAKFFCSEDASVSLMEAGGLASPVLASILLLVGLAFAVAAVLACQLSMIALSNYDMINVEMIC